MSMAKKEGWVVLRGQRRCYYEGLEEDVYWTGVKLEDLPREKVKMAIDEVLEERREKK